MARHFDKNLVIVLALLAAGFFLAYLRFLPYLGHEGSFTDGARLYDGTDEEGLRFAIWEDPRPLPESVNTPAREVQPALSPDGRHLVFTVGQQGLNADLWVAEVVDGVPVAPRPLSEVNTDYDEMAPAFSGSELYLASSRPGGAGRLDLYRSRYRDGRFETAEHLEGEINTAADDTDPAPVPGTEALAFASDRPRGTRKDFDIYQAVAARPDPAGPAQFRVDALDSLNSISQDREPAFTADGSSLIFATNRVGAVGGFDLFRSVRDRGEWLPPEPVAGVNTELSERGPDLSRDGFTLLFSVESDERDGDLFRARSRELFRIPGRPVGWLDMLVLSSLLLLALLAFLAKRWERLEFLYKCFLFSALAHGLLLLWFRQVSPEPSTLEMPDTKPMFKVRLAPDRSRSLARNVERAGAVEAARQIVQAVAPERSDTIREDREANARARELARLTAPDAVTPDRTSAEHARSESVPVPQQEVQQPQRTAERLAATAPVMAVAANTESQTPQERSTEVLRTEAATPAEAAAAPEQVETRRAARSTESAPAPTAIVSALQPEAVVDSQLVRSTEVSLPREQAERVAGEAPALAVAASPSAQAELPTISTPVRAAEPAAGFDPSARQAIPTRSALPRPTGATLASAEQAPGRAGLADVSRLDQSAPDVEVAAHRETVERLADSSGLDLALESAQFAAVLPSAAAGVEPERRAETAEIPEGSAQMPAEVALEWMASRPAEQGPGRSDLSELDRSARALPGMELEAQPDESFERLSSEGGEPGELALAPSPDTVSPTAWGEGPRRDATAPDLAAANAAMAPELEGLERAGGPPLVASAAPAREQLEALEPGRQATAGPEPTLAAPQEQVLVADEGGEAIEFEALEPLAASGLARSTEAGGPARFLTPEAAAAETGESPELEPGPLLALSGSELSAPLPERSGEIAPMPERAGRRDVSLDDSEGVALVTAEEGEGESIGELALAAQEGFERSENRSSGPSRRSFRPGGEEVQAASAVEAPAFTPLLASERNPVPGEESAPSRFEHTPYRSRFGAEKRVAIAQHGGSAETEEAVDKGLRYLARIQTRNGNWGSRDDYNDKYGHVAVGKTGLCLLAFLGAGHTPKSGTEYSVNAERALRFLLAVQDQESGHFGYSSSYSHGIATYSLAECYALTQDERLLEPLRGAVGQILDKQNRSRDPRLRGGWSYFYADNRTFDPWPRVSITSWQVMALESARLAGIDVPDRAFDEARLFLLNAFDTENGWFRYSHDPSRLRSEYPTLPASTPAGLFALSLLGDDTLDTRFDIARSFILRRAPAGYRSLGEQNFVRNAQGNLYFWYYGTLAMFRTGGESWDRWNAAMKRTLLTAQAADGSWEPISAYASYAGDDERDRSYTTAMNVLSLEVYYRYFTPLLKVR